MSLKRLVYYNVPFQLHAAARTAEGRPWSGDLPKLRCACSTEEVVETRLPRRLPWSVLECVDRFVPRNRQLLPGCDLLAPRQGQVTTPRHPECQQHQ